MPRYPSDRTIRDRAEIAYHLAQALARNPGYQRDIADLQAAHDADMARALIELRRRTHILPPDQLRPIQGRASTGRWPQLKAKKRKKRGSPLGRMVEPLKGGRCPGFFDADGWEIPHSGNLERQAQKIRERAGLVLLVLPKRLRRLTPKKIAILRPIFVGVPGWNLVRGRYRPVPLPRLGKRHRDLKSEYWRVYDLRRQRKREREIIAALWPNERPRAARPAEKDYLRQRVYDYDRRAARLIEAAYPAVARAGPVCGWCHRRLGARGGARRHHPRCAAQARAQGQRTAVMVRRYRRQAMIELNADLRAEMEQLEAQLERIKREERHRT